MRGDARDALGYSVQRAPPTAAGQMRGWDMGIQVIPAPTTDRTPMPAGFQSAQLVVRAALNCTALVIAGVPATGAAVAARHSQTP